MRRAVATGTRVALREVEQSYPGGEFRLALERLELEPGERLALVGPSGSGKSTLLNLVAGILRPERGQVLLDEVALPDSEAGRRQLRLERIGMVFQELELLPYLTGLENVLLPLRLGRGRIAQEQAARAAELAARFGVADRLRALPARMSGGERQRMALARALVTEAPLWLLDEPTGSLDRGNAERAVDRLWEEAERTGATVLMVTHDERLAARCDRRFELGAPHAGTGGPASLAPGGGR